jgi:NAD(P)-dependent dehydrogenase (short-subunit alcohol dehydrogenase family)
MTSTKPLETRVALVTGASRGIGRATAIALAEAGAHVVALARTQGGLEELDDAIKAIGGSATLVPVSVTDYEALDRLGAALYERWGKLDVFVANAGMLGPLTPLAHLDPKDWEKLVAVNVTANLRLIRSLDLLLRKSDAGRVVMLTSGAAHRADMKAYWGPYAITKGAVDTMVRTYAAETQAVTPIKIMAVNPGPLRTRMRAQAMPGEDPLTLKTPEELAPKIVDLCLPAWGETGKLYDFPSDTVLSFSAPSAG